MMTCNVFELWGVYYRQNIGDDDNYPSFVYADENDDVFRTFDDIHEFLPIGASQ